MTDLKPTGYLSQKEYATCGRCFQRGIPPLDKIAVLYVGKSEDRITGRVRHNFIFVDPVHCLKCGARIYDIFVDAEFKPIEEGSAGERP